MIPQIVAVVVPASLEPSWKWATLTFVSAGVWALLSITALATATTALVVANGVMYRVVTNLVPANASDAYWHVWIPALAVGLHCLTERRSAGHLIDYSVPLGFACFYSALIMLGVLNQYQAIHCQSFSLKVACMMLYCVLTLIAVRLLQ